jgi:hypothetical protein
VIVGRYTMDLYCKYDQASTNHGRPIKHCGGSFQYCIGSTEGACKRESKRRGWKWVDGGTEVICKSCYASGLR